MKDKRDVASLLDVPYSTLFYHLYIFPEDKRYVQFGIPKRSGNTRLISAPVSPLKLVQGKLNQVLQAVYKPKPSSHGYIQGRSILTNARPHAGRRFVLNLDLANFFPSINFGRVRGLFLARPFSLPPEVATVLAQICCYKKQLPQGAPTSPIVSNMIARSLDNALQQLASAASRDLV